MSDAHTKRLVTHNIYKSHFLLKVKPPNVP